MRVVDVAADLLALAVHVPNEDYARQLSVANQLFSVAYSEEERGHAQILITPASNGGKINKRKNEVGWGAIR